MKKAIFTVVAIISMTLISGCVSNSGNHALNSRAFELRNAFKGSDSLKQADLKLQACIVGSFLFHLELGIEQPKISTIEYACEKQEIEYRAAVMAQVRPAWQSEKNVLINTANTATSNVYKTALERFIR